MKQRLRGVVRLFRHQAGLVVATAMLLLLTLGAGVGLLTLSGHFLTAAALAGGTAATFNLFGPAAGIRALTFVRILSRYAEKLLGHEATLRLARDLRVWFFRRVLPLAPLSLGRERAGDLLARLVADIEAVDGIWVRAVGPLLALLLLIVGVVGACIWVLPSVGFWISGVLLLVVLSMPLTMGHARTLEQAQAQARAALRQSVQEGLEGVADLQALGGLDRQAAHVDHQSRVLAVADRRLQGRLAMATLVHGVATALGLSGLLWLGTTAAAQGHVSAPEAVALLFAGVATFEAMAGVGLAWQSLRAALISLGRLQQIVDRTPAVADPAGPQSLPERAGLHLEGVVMAWSHDGVERRVLDDVRLRLPYGGRIAIHGDSGAGKSSLLALLLRLRDPDAGAIRYGDIDLRDAAQADWHRHIAWLPQDAMVFAGSIRDNLRLGAPEADDAKLWWALDRVLLADVVRRLPEQLDAWLLEGGVNLSAGQSRRLALARVLLRDAPILLLDELTEGLDADTASAVLRNVADAVRGRSLVIITHDELPAAIVDAHYLLRDGRLQLLPPDEAR
ncbi:MAG: thiol reductant ABC exporter subunit CydC [Xanthomonadaceae bacterium]|jgi:ATP-binding cassette subfamily C protein CydC|nr:thiol reductant ABC exporter subunit CydC [Xanthomonadaceae bacterium]